jgi:phage terminase large subunit-like protein
MAVSTAPNPYALAADLLDPPSIDWAWERRARPKQLPPAGDWFVWLIMAGRGWGKTQTGSEWIARQALMNPGREYAIVARTTSDVHRVCLEGRSGVLRVLGLTRDSENYNRTTGQIRLPNGSIIHAFSAEKADSVLGANLSGAWCDELASWRYEETWTRGLIPALRIGDPQVVVTTTPRPVGLVRDLVGRTDGSVVVTRGSTFENAENLSASALAELKLRYEGTRLGRQELEGELIEDVDGALWTRDMFETRVVWEEGWSPERDDIDEVDPQAPEPLVAPSFVGRRTSRARV